MKTTDPNIEKFTTEFYADPNTAFIKPNKDTPRIEETIRNIEAQLEDGYIDLGLHDQDELEIIKEAINLLKTVDKFNSIGCTSFQMTPNENVEYGRWVYWDGWIGNSCQRIDDAVCSNCGYKHPTVYWTKGDEHNSTPNKLADICPNCKAIMNKWSGR